MKKIFTAAFIIGILATNIYPAMALNVGTYKTETEYGLLDGFKFNWKNRDKNTPFMEPREKSTKEELQKEYKDYKDSEYERTKYMYDGRAIL